MPLQEYAFGMPIGPVVPLGQAVPKSLAVISHTAMLRDDDVQSVAIRSSSGP
jgi:hypothetical protein